MNHSSRSNTRRGERREPRNKHHHHHHHRHGGGSRTSEYNDESDASKHEQDSQYARSEECEEEEEEDSEYIDSFVSGSSPTSVGKLQTSNGAPLAYPLIAIATSGGILVFTIAFVMTHSFALIATPFLLLTGVFVVANLWMNLHPQTHACVSCMLRDASDISSKDIDKVYHESWLHRMQHTRSSVGQISNLRGFFDTLAYAWSNSNVMVAWVSDLLPAVVAVLGWLLYSVAFGVHTHSPSVEEEAVPDEIVYKESWLIFQGGERTQILIHIASAMMIVFTNRARIYSIGVLRKMFFLVGYVGVLYTPHLQGMATTGSLFWSTIPRVVSFTALYLLIDLDMKDAAKHSMSRKEHKEIAVADYFTISAERRFMQSAWILWVSNPIYAALMGCLFPFYRIFSRVRIDTKKDDDVRTGIVDVEVGIEESEDKGARRKRKKKKKRRRRRRKDYDQGASSNDEYGEFATFSITHH